MDKMVSGNEDLLYPVSPTTKLYYSSSWCIAYKKWHQQQQQQPTRRSPESTSSSLISILPSRRSTYKSWMLQLTRIRWELTHLANVFFCTLSRSSSHTHNISSSSSSQEHLASHTHHCALHPLLSSVANQRSSSWAVSCVYCPPERRHTAHHVLKDKQSDI